MCECFTSSSYKYYSYIYMYAKVIRKFLRQQQTIDKKKKKIVKYVDLNPFMASVYNLWQQLQFNCRRINFEVRKDGVDTSV